MKYITTKITMTYRSPTSWTTGWIGKGFIFDLADSDGNWVAYRNNKGQMRWVSSSNCAIYIDTIPPVPLVEIWHTNPGNTKKPGYKPEGINYGSFDIGWLLPEEPEKIVNKPAGFKLLPKHIQYLYTLNDNNSNKVGWLISQKGNDKVLSVDEAGNYKCPVPCYSGNNKVRVLEVSGEFARIETVSIYEPLPPTLPDYLCHTWWAFTLKGKYYMQMADLGGIKYPLYARGESAWVQLSGISR